MPLYEYQCDACGHRFEKIQKHSDPLIDQCPKCGGTVHKLQSAPAFQFKGSGWYVTDYGKKDSGKGSKSDSSQESSSTDKGDKSTKKEKTESTEKKPASGTTTPSSKADV